jgi:hypothetical protein
MNQIPLIIPPEAPVEPVRFVSYVWKGLWGTGLYFGNSGEVFARQFLFGLVLWWIVTIVLLGVGWGIWKLIRRKSVIK